MTHLHLLVLRTDQLERTLAFYAALGLTFVQEQHGAGPVHYASERGGFVLEIFPAKAPGSAPEYRAGGATMLGFQVEDLNRVLAGLENLGIRPENPPKETTWGLRALIFDPDGRGVELIQPLA